MTLERKIALDLSLYDPKKLQGIELRRRFVGDLSSLFLEVAPRVRTGEGVTPYTWRQRPDGEIIWPEFSDQPIEKHLRWETKADILESRATLEIRDIMLSSEGSPLLVVWISPPDEELGYNEGRMVIGIVEDRDGLKSMNSYGICLDLEPGQCLSLAENLFSLSTKEEKEPALSIDQLRATPIAIKISEEVSPLKFIAQLIPQLSHIWQAIESGRVDEREKKAQKDATRVFREIVKPNIDTMDLVALGALAEREMIGLGWEANFASSGCGLSNSEVLSSRVFLFNHTHQYLDREGKTVSTATESGVFCQECPYCGESINERIKPGFKCPHCGRVYGHSC